MRSEPKVALLCSRSAFPPAPSATNNGDDADDADDVNNPDNVNNDDDNDEDNAPGRRLSQLGYVPPATDCQGITATASAVYADGFVTGTVVITNPQQYALPLQSVRVQVSNTVPVAPLFVDAACPSMSVPANPEPFQLGTLACTFSAQLPSDGIASDPASWTAVMPKVTIAMSNAQCSGAVTQIDEAEEGPGPILYG